MKQIDTFYATYKFHGIDVKLLFFRIHTLVAVRAEMSTHVPKDLPPNLRTLEVKHAVYIGNEEGRIELNQVRAAVRELVCKVSDDFSLPELGMILAVVPQYNAQFDQA